MPSQDLQHFCWLVFDLLQKGWLLPSPVLDVVLQYLGVRFGSGSLAQVAAEGFDEVLSTIQKDGRLTLTGRNCEEHDVPEGLPPAKALAAGFFHTCLLTMKLDSPVVPFSFFLVQGSFFKQPNPKRVPL